MAQVLHVYYRAQAPQVGEILDAAWGAMGVPPRPLATGEGRLELESVDTFPTRATHKVVNGAVVARSASDATAVAQADRKVIVERALGGLDAMRAAMLARGFSVVAIDVEIAALVAEHATLP